ncbi:hypothetical protein AAG570_012626 [Ranatra chinensis]|uniref:Uncharacterized protein n=1 Tax=Ranatra chinensis TaxID=642074 RepID=A0ABD0YEP6_9HEMI
MRIAIPPRAVRMVYNIRKTAVWDGDHTTATMMPAASLFTWLLCSPLRLTVNIKPDHGGVTSPIAFLVNNDPFLESAATKFGYVGGPWTPKSDENKPLQVPDYACHVRYCAQRPSSNAEVAETSLKDTDNKTEKDFAEMSGTGDRTAAVSTAFGSGASTKEQSEAATEKTKGSGASDEIDEDTQVGVKPETLAKLGSASAVGSKYTAGGFGKADEVSDIGEIKKAANDSGQEEQAATEGAKVLAEGPKVAAEGSKAVSEGPNAVAQGSKSPTEDSNAPTEDPKAPTEDSKVPTEGPKAPTEGQKAPTEGQKAPTEGQKAPTEGQKAPTEGQKAPTEGQKAPTEGQKAPTEGQKAPTEGQKAPTEGQKAPTEGQKAPTEGQKAPTEEKKAPKEGPMAPEEGPKTPKEGPKAFKDTADDQWEFKFGRTGNEKVTNRGREEGKSGRGNGSNRVESTTVQEDDQSVTASEVGPITGQSESDTDTSNAPPHQTPNSLPIPAQLTGSDPNAILQFCKENLAFLRELCCNVIKA